MITGDFLHHFYNEVRYLLLTSGFSEQERVQISFDRIQQLQRFSSCNYFGMLSC